MKKRCKNMRYEEYIKRLLIFNVFGFILFAILFVSELHFYKYILILVWVAVDVFLLIIRKMNLKRTAFKQLDFIGAYEFDRYGNENRIHNLYLFMRVLFYQGELPETAGLCDVLMARRLRPEMKHEVAFYKILSLLIMKDTEEVLSLIDKERKGRLRIFSKKYKPYYQFAEYYLNSEYEKAIEVIKEIPRSQNNRKDLMLVSYHLMRLAYLKIGDFHNAQNCFVNILVIDRNRRTFFSDNPRCKN